MPTSLVIDLVSSDDESDAGDGAMQIVNEADSLGTRLTGGMDRLEEEERPKVESELEDNEDFGDKSKCLLAVAGAS